MPFGAGMDAETDQGTLVFWKKDPDNKRPVHFRLRRIDAEWDRDLRKRIAKGFGNPNKVTAADAVDRTVRLTRERAAYALLDSHNFSVVVDGPKAAAFFDEQLKPAEPFKAGDVVLLDGHWTHEVKQKLLHALPKLTAWLSDQADELTKLEAEEEEEETTSFR